MNDPVRVPLEALSSDALDALIEEYVSRDGTDYGAQETPLQHRVDQVKRALRNKTAIIVFDPDSQTTHIVPREWCTP